MSRLETTNESRHKGRVKFFNSRKGYGFILPEGKEGEEEAEGIHYIFFLLDKNGLLNTHMP